MSGYRYDDDEIDARAFDEDEESDDSGPGFTVAMRGAPNMATVQWSRTEAEAIKKTAREWGCKESDLYIYRGFDE